ncbi:MAG: cysteine-rich small domain-containing protein [Eubacterium sp.]|nr:cysteine-rich small domain-containing protein [Eubacterium sp.]
MKNSSSYFQIRDCEFFPCHKTGEGEYFNCLFCFCPLYTLGDKCGGNFVYTDKGIKDCSNCTLPHSKKGYEYINERFPELSELAKQKRT